MQKGSTKYNSPKSAGHPISDGSTIFSPIPPSPNKRRADGITQPLFAIGALQNFQQSYSEVLPPKQIILLQVS